MIEIDEIELMPFSSITDEDLAQTGEPDLEALRRRAAHAGPIHEDTVLYRVEFHIVWDSGTAGQRDSTSRKRARSGTGDTRRVDAVEVTFKKSDNGRTCSWVALRPPRSRVPGPTMAAGGDLPHDLSTFVIEATLGIAHGFWGCVADGATFRSLGRKRTKPGRAVIQRHRDELDQAEGRVNEIYFAWRRGEMTPASQELDQALTRWQRLPNGAELALEWVGTRRPRTRTRR